MPHYGPDVINEVLALIDSGKTQGEVSRERHIPQPTISRWLKERRAPHHPERNPADVPVSGDDATPAPAIPNETPGDPERNGHLPAIPTPSHPVAVPSQPIAVASQPIAVDVDDLKGRVAILEAFMAAMQAQQCIVAMPSQPIAAQPVAVHRSEQIPWVSRGLQMATDMAEAIDTYATEHRLEKREVLDLALRTFFAQVEGDRAPDEKAP
jgi:hypothetical protein